MVSKHNGNPYCTCTVRLPWDLSEYRAIVSLVPLGCSSLELLVLSFPDDSHQDLTQ